MKFFIYLSFIFFYILPNSFLEINNINIYQINRAIYNLIGIFYLVCILKNNHYNLKIREIFLILFVFLRIILLRDYEAMSLLLLILIDRIKIEKIKFRKIFILILVFIIIYSIYFIKITGRPIATSIAEINVSGFSILILYLICDLQNYRILKKIFLYIGIFTFSRNFLLAIVIKYFLEKLKLKTKVINIFNNFFIISIFSLILMLGIGKIFEDYVKNNGVDIYQKGLKRYTTIIDNSNLYRFQANINVIKFYKMNPKKLITGEKLEEFRNNIKAKKEIYKVEEVRSPHNFYYKYLLKYGIFSFYLFWYISKIIGKITNKNLKYFIPYYLYSLILGVGFYDFYLLALKYIFFIKKSNK